MIITTHGPFFEPGAREESMTMLAGQSSGEVGQQALADVHGNLNAFIRHPTPYYETQVALGRSGAFAVVGDHGVIYGPWLEGTSKRNATTRFKGYASFRKATQSTNAKVPQLVEPHVRAAVARLS